MDKNILKQLYENIDNIENFVILVDNNYDPDKKLLYCLLNLINNDLIECESLYLICDIINKLLKQKNYKDDFPYFGTAVNIKIFEIVKLLITYKIKINDDELKYLNNIKNPSKIIDLMITNGYRDQIKRYFIEQGIIQNKYINDMNIELIKTLISKYREDITGEILNLIVSIKRDINLVKFISTTQIYNFVTIKQYCGCTNYCPKNCTIFDYILDNNLLDVEKDFDVDDFFIHCQHNISKILSLYKDKISKDFLFYTLLTTECENCDYLNKNINYIFKEFKFMSTELKTLKDKYKRKYDKFVNNMLRFQKYYREKINLYINNGIIDVNEIPESN
ncbi:MAG: hypothetical protein QW478_05520 [Candidatus Micrarchaeaceae archaeon]